MDGSCGDEPIEAAGPAELGVRERDAGGAVDVASAVGDAVTAAGTGDD